jgi:hypothetical protein
VSTSKIDPEKINLPPDPTTAPQFCSKQAATIMFKEKPAWNSEIEEPVCGSKETIELLLKSKQTGILSFPDENNCAPVVVVVELPQHQKFFVKTASLCLRADQAAQFKEEFMYYKIDIQPGEMYTKP